MATLAVQKRRGMVGLAWMVELGLFHSCLVKQWLLRICCREYFTIQPPESETRKIENQKMVAR